MNPKDAWETAYHQLEHQLDRGSFDTWLRGAAYVAVEEGVFVIGVRNEYARDVLQNRLLRNVRRVLADVCGEAVDIRFVVRRAQPVAERAVSSDSTSSADEMPLFRLLAQQEAIQAAEPDPEPLPPVHQRIVRPQRPPLPESDLNPRYTFERFIVNGSNRISYEAARAVVENPAQAYNPFFVYGGVGLGKTHLLQAIAHAYNARGLRAIYIPAEVFLNDLVDALRHKTTAMFRDKYRSVDALLVDDIHFIAGKDSTQEEFFHTFNALYTFNRQIVMASDRHPRELTTLEDRLRSRFEGGLITDVQPLEFETRLAILEMWAQERALHIAPDILEMIGQHAPPSVREMEGFFTQVIARSKLGGAPLTVQSARHMLENFQGPRDHHLNRVISPQQIIETTAAYFQLSVKELTGKRRTSRINQARQVAMFLTRELTDASLPQIGDVFGGRSHTTVLHGCNRIAEEVEFDPALRQRLGSIRAEVQRRA